MQHTKRSFYFNIWLVITFHLLRITIHVLILHRITLHEVSSEYLKILNKYKNDIYLLLREFHYWNLHWWLERLRFADHIGQFGNAGKTSWSKMLWLQMDLLAPLVKLNTINLGNTSAAAIQKSKFYCSTFALVIKLARYFDANFKDQEF